LVNETPHEKSPVKSYDHIIRGTVRTVSVTEAARNFCELVSSVHYRGESALLVKGGRPMVRLIPALRPKTGRDLGAFWSKLPHLTITEAEGLERDLNDARRALHPIKSKWD
jgi:antitoxin (DNA-binding transcriptional repressor) of toxin-antitoxin stability system